MTVQEKVYLHVARKIRPPTSVKINRAVRAAAAARNWPGSASLLYL